MPEIVDQVVVGGGIVGAATARHLSAPRPAAVCSCSTRRTASAPTRPGTTAASSTPGIYYEPGSLKAEMCRRGARLTEEYAAEHDIAVEKHRQAPRRHRRRASSRGLQALEERAADQPDPGRGPRRRRAAAARARRAPGWGRCGCPAPASPTTGDQRAPSPRTSAAAGGEVRTGVARHRHPASTPTGSASTTATGEQVEARQVVFCAGLQSDRLARLAGLDHRLPHRAVPRRVLRRRRRPSRPGQLA